VEANDFTHAYDNSDLTVWSTKLSAKDFLHQLEEQACEHDLCEVEIDLENKKFRLVDDKNGLKVGVKFNFDDGEDLMKVQFMKKQGSIVNFFQLLKKLQDVLEDTRAPSLC